MSSSVRWLWIFKLDWNRSSIKSNFLAVPWKVGIGVVRVLGSFKSLLMLLLMLAPTAEGPTKTGLLQMSQGSSHLEIVDELWSAPFFVFLEKSQGSSKECLPEFLSPCEDDSKSLLELLLPCRGD